MNGSAQGEAAGLAAEPSIAATFHIHLSSNVSPRMAELTFVHPCSVLANTVSYNIYGDDTACVCDRLVSAESTGHGHCSKLGLEVVPFVIALSPQVSNPQDKQKTQDYPADWIRNKPHEVGNQCRNEGRPNQKQWQIHTHSPSDSDRKPDLTAWPKSILGCDWRFFLASEPQFDMGLFDRPMRSLSSSPINNSLISTILASVC